MSNFEKYAVKGTCECCNKETNVVVCSSGIVPISFSYCKECLNNGIEPYSALVCASAGVGIFPNDFNEAYVKRFRISLNYYKVSDEKFNNDIRKLEKEVEQYEI